MSVFVLVQGNINTVDIFVTFDIYLLPNQTKEQIMLH